MRHESTNIKYPSIHAGTWSRNLWFLNFYSYISKSRNDEPQNLKPTYHSHFLFLNSPIGNWWNFPRVKKKASSEPIFIYLCFNLSRNNRTNWDFGYKILPTKYKNWPESSLHTDGAVGLDVQSIVIWMHRFRLVTGICTQSAKILWYPPHPAVTFSSCGCIKPSKF